VRICPRCGESYSDKDAQICGWDGTRLAAAPSAENEQPLDAFGMMPSGVEISLVVPEQPKKVANRT